MQFCADSYKEQLVLSLTGVELNGGFEEANGNGGHIVLGYPVVGLQRPF